MMNVLRISKFLSFLAILALAFTACNKDPIQDLNANVEENLTNNNGDSNGTGDDNDGTGGENDSDFGGDCEDFCFDLNYPVEVLLPDGTTQTANDDVELEAIFENWFIQNPTDTANYPMLVFPIEVTLEDGSIQTINGEEDFEALIDTCFDGYDDDDWGDDDWEGDCEDFCFDLNYPVDVLLPNGATQTANDDDELEAIFEDWFTQNPTDTTNYPMLVFPIEVTLEDGSIQTLNSEEDFDALLNTCFSDDDDDDDDDWGDDEFEECFILVFPVEVALPDGGTQIANDEDELFDIFTTWFEQNPNSMDLPTFVFPLEVELEDGSTQTVNSEEDLDLLFEDCYGDEFEDCFTINYPVTIVFPDGSEATVNSDDELVAAVDNWYTQNPNSEEDPTFAYPIEVTLEDGSTHTVNSDDELDALFEDCYGDECDVNGMALIMNVDNTSTATAITPRKR